MRLNCLDVTLQMLLEKKGHVLSVGGDMFRVDTCVSSVLVFHWPCMRRLQIRDCGGLYLCAVVMAISS